MTDITLVSVRDVLAIINSDVEMEFEGYYKYSFTYVGKFVYNNEEYTIKHSFGGYPDDIYRISLDKKMLLSELIEYEDEESDFTHITKS